MKFENTEVFNFEGALRGMRNPLESWDKSDSFNCDSKADYDNCKRCRFNNGGNCNNPMYDENYYIIGKNDLKLAQSLITAGSEHRKFLRQIFVSVDITAPLYWWKEFDTYKVGTVSNSTSTMHKLASTPITMDCFELTSVKLCEAGKQYFEELENMRIRYNELKNTDAEKAKRYWKALIQLLPESWLQKRTITMNYENILNMYHQRKHHKLTEWSKSFCDWVKTLPYAEELICFE